MRSGETLIKLAKYKVDSVQKLISAAERTHSDLNKKLESLDCAKAKELELVSKNPELCGNYNAFLKGWNMQRANVEASLAGVEDQLRALAIDLAEAFEEQKKFETIEERRQARAAEQAKKRELAQMDEFAITRTARAS